MKIHHLGLAFVLATSACSSARVDSAAAPPGLFPAGDEDLTALREAQLAMGASGTLPATPQGKARAYADMEYVAGVFNTSGRWDDLPGVGQTQILTGRREVRDYLGISQQAPSQAAFNALLAVSQAPDGAGLTQAVSNPVFTLGPQETLAKLQASPHFMTVPYALAHLGEDIRRERDGSEGGGMRM